MVQLQQDKIVLFLLLWIVIWPVSLVIINNWPSSPTPAAPQEQTQAREEGGLAAAQNALDFRSLPSDFGTISVLCSGRAKSVDVVFHRRTSPLSLEDTVVRLCDENIVPIVEESVSLSERLHSVVTYQLQSAHSGGASLLPFSFS